MGGSFKLTKEFGNRFYIIRHLPPKFKSFKLNLKITILRAIKICSIKNFDELSKENLIVRIQKIKDIFKLI